MKRNDSIVSLPSPPMDVADLPAQQHPTTSAAASSSTLESSEMQIDATAQLDNPFRSAQASTSNYRADRPDHPSASPTQNARKQRRIDKDRMIIKAKCTKGELRGMGMGWEDTSNPFIERKTEEDSPEVVRTKNQGATPEKMTYVLFVLSPPASSYTATDQRTRDSRGKRITYDFPLSNLLAPDPGESPFPVPSPRLLFPAPPITPPSSNPTSSFLDALRSVKRSVKEVDHGLPTPVRERDSKRSRKDGEDGSRRMR